VQSARTSSKPPRKQLDNKQLCRELDFGHAGTLADFKLRAELPAITKSVWPTSMFEQAQVCFA